MFLKAEKREPELTLLASRKVSCSMVLEQWNVRAFWPEVRARTGTKASRSSILPAFPLALVYRRCLWNNVLMWIQTGKLSIFKKLFSILRVRMETCKTRFIRKCLGTSWNNGSERRFIKPFPDSNHQFFTLFRWKAVRWSDIDLQSRGPPSNQFFNSIAPIILPLVADLIHFVATSQARKTFYMEALPCSNFLQFMF